MEIEKCSEADAKKELELIKQDNQIIGQDVDWTDRDKDDSGEDQDEEEQGDVNEPSEESTGGGDS